MSPKKIVLIVAIFLLAIGLFQYSRPLPTVQPTITILPPKTSEAVKLPWPVYGQGALAVQGYGMLQTHGQQKAVPMASIAKVVTALAVFRQKPLAPGQSGPSITISSNDVAIYNSYYAQGGSVVKVENGEQLSELQALQALLIPSANNMADTLVRWAFGSMENYLTYANKMLQSLSLPQTKVADASGFSALSVGTSQDLVRLGLATINNPVLAGIVAQQTANLPVGGEVNNVNWLLGSDGVIGIKTGNTEEAGGCFLFAAKRAIGDQTVTLVGALMQAPDLNTAIKDSQTLISASDKGFEFTKVISKGQTVGVHQAAWGATSEDTAQGDLVVLAWRGTKIQPNATLNEVRVPALAGTNVGSVTSAVGQKASSVPAVLKNDIAAPTWYWRIFR